MREREREREKERDISESPTLYPSVEYLYF